MDRSDITTSIVMAVEAKNRNGEFMWEPTSVEVDVMGEK